MAQLSLLSRVLMSKLMPVCCRRTMLLYEWSRSRFHTVMWMCEGSMVISDSMPQRSAIRLTFFSMRMQVAPQPSSHAA